jgi:hypothetical protein
MNQKKLFERLVARCEDVFIGGKVLKRPFRCPMCEGREFIQGAGYFAHFVQDGPEAVQIGGKRLTTIHLICACCGFLSQHVPTVFTSDAVIADLPQPKDKWPKKTGSGWPDKYYPGM